MFRDFLCHLEHIDRTFGSKYFSELFVRNDVTLIFRVLTIVFFNVSPQFFDNFCTW